MTMNPWLRRNLLFVFLMVPLWPMGCGSNEVPTAASGGASGFGAVAAGAGASNGGSSASAGHGASAGAIVGTGGAQTGAAGARSGAGGSSAGGGGTPVTAGGMPAAGGTASGAAGSAVVAGGAAGNGGASGVSGSSGAPMAGTGQANPCANVTCGAGQACMNGTCTCVMGTLCGGTCIDTQNDVNHCGTCDKKCDANGSCVNGACVNPTCNVDTMTRNGHVTHYNLATSMVACHYPTSSLPNLYGAMNEYDWNTSGVCGACVEISNGGTKAVVQIVDECPYQGNEQWCYQGSHHIDLNPAANSALHADSNPAVTWHYVPCTPTGNIKYYFDSASQQYYLAVTPMNHKNLVAKMEVKKDGTFTALTHTNYNTYELKSGAGTGMLTLRLTDIYNHVVTDTVTMTPGQIVQGNVQFAACP